MNTRRISPVFALFLIGSVLIVTNCGLVVLSNGPIILSSSPSMTHFSNWEDFKSSFVNVTQPTNVTSVVTGVTYVHKEPDQTIIVEVQESLNVSGVVSQRILSFSANFPGALQTRRTPALLRQWVVDELSVENETVTENQSLSIQSINKVSIWGRFAFGIPGMIEGLLGYVWLILSIAILAMVLATYMKPVRRQSLAPWIVGFSLLTFLAGGGFIVGALLCIVIGAAGFAWTKRFRETFFGTMIDVARLNAKAIRAIAEDERKIRQAVNTVIVVAVLSSIGVGLYAYNVSLVHTQDAISNLRSIYNMLVQGSLFSGMEVFFGALSSVTVAILKWLGLSAIVYLIGVKLLRFEFKFSSMAAVLAFVYVPEAIQALTPAIFFNEPFLSQGLDIGIMSIPVTWPILLFFISRLWAFALLVVALATVMEISNLRALGVGLLVGTIYGLAEYVFVYPQVEIPGLRIEFANSAEMILMAAAILFLIAILLGAFKKES
ncbi:hypothetical protein MUP01_03565 [Candidatus Bathyarchaeota archaeon]|nr:hypothetical protein [Candidatus Bathyarchaeota archaeon]